MPGGKFPPPFGLCPPCASRGCQRAADALLLFGLGGSGCRGRSRAQLQSTAWQAGTGPCSAGSRGVGRPPGPCPQGWPRACCCWLDLTSFSKTATLGHNSHSTDRPLLNPVCSQSAAMVSKVQFLPPGIPQPSASVPSPPTPSPLPLPVPAGSQVNHMTRRVGLPPSA